MLNLSTATIDLKKKERFSDAVLLLIAIVWGFCFPFVKQCLNSGMSSTQLVFFKFLISAIALSIAFFPHFKEMKATDFKVGLMSGGLLFAANYISTLGQGLTTPANSAIINSSYIILIPLIEPFFGRPRPSWKTVLCALICFAGITLINYDPSQSFRIQAGDVLVLLGAVFFALQIAQLGTAVTRMSAQKITLFQVITCTLLSAIACLITDGSLMKADARPVIWPLLYVSLLGTAFGYGGQIFAQRYSKPSKAGILMALEGMFGAVFSVLLGMSVFTIGLGLGTIFGLLSVVLLRVFSAHASSEEATCNET